MILEVRYGTVRIHWQGRENKESDIMMRLGFLRLFVFWAALLALAVGGASFVLRRTGNPVPVLAARGRPMLRQVLDQRFARRGISLEDYEALRAETER